MPSRFPKGRGLPKARNPSVDELWVYLRAHLIREADSLEHARAIGIDQYVSGLNHEFYGVDIFFLLEVEGQALLSSIHEVRRLGCIASR